MARSRRAHRASDDTRTTPQRGYGWDHQQIRARWQRIIDSGVVVVCWRCGEAIRPAGTHDLGDPWDLGHDDHDRRLYRGPEHAACNRSAAGRVAAAVTEARRQGATALRW